MKGAGGKVDAIRLKAGEGTSDIPRISADAMIPYELLMAGKIAEAVEGYKKIQREKPNNNAIAEGRLNSLGSSLLEQKRVAEAIAMLKVNVELHPRSARAHESLGEAYMSKGDKDLAIASYRKSLDLDPRSKNASDMLKKLER